MGISRGLLLLAVAPLACDGAPPPEERPIPAQLPVARREEHRRLPVEGAANLRDLGGYARRDGRTLRWGTLYRSDALADLTDADVAYLERLELRRVVDFRSAPERERDPDRLPSGVEVTFQPISGSGLDPVALQEQLLAGEVSAARAAAWLEQGNRAFVTEFQSVYARFLLDLADAENLLRERLRANLLE